jgi:hypothetical protein
VGLAGGPELTVHLDLLLNGFFNLQVRSHGSGLVLPLRLVVNKVGTALESIEGFIIFTGDPLGLQQVVTGLAERLVGEGAGIHQWSSIKVFIFRELLVPIRSPPRTHIHGVFSSLLLGSGCQVPLHFKRLSIRQWFLLPLFSLVLLILIGKLYRPNSPSDDDTLDESIPQSVVNPIETCSSLYSRLV